MKEKIEKIIQKLEKLRELYWFSDTVCKYVNDSIKELKEIIK